MKLEKYGVKMQGLKKAAGETKHLMGHAKPRRVIWRGVTCLHRAPAALDRPARYSFGCFALRAPHHRGFARRPLLWAVL